MELTLIMLAVAAVLVWGAVVRVLTSRLCVQLRDCQLDLLREARRNPELRAHPAFAEVLLTVDGMAVGVKRAGVFSLLVLPTYAVARKRTLSTALVSRHPLPPQVIRDAFDKACERWTVYLAFRYFYIVIAALVAGLAVAGIVSSVRWMRRVTQPEQGPTEAVEAWVRASARAGAVRQAQALAPAGAC